MTTTNTLTVTAPAAAPATVRLPYAQRELPLRTLFEALGCGSPTRIAALCRVPLDGVLGRCWLGAEDDDALPSEALRERALVRVADACALRPNHEAPARAAGAWHKLQRDLLSNAAQHERCKLHTLAWIVRRLWLVHERRAAPTDIDHLAWRRVDCAGAMMAALFRNTFSKVCSDLRMFLQRDVSQNKVPDLSNAFRPSTLTHAFSKALATGNWCHDRPHVTTRSGVSQQLNRHNVISSYSSLRRISHAMSREGKATLPRALNSTTWGFYCPCKTPEGIACGLVRALALFAYVTVPHPRYCHLDAWLDHWGVVRCARTDLDDAAHDALAASARTVVLWNGAVVGYSRDERAETLAVLVREAKRDVCAGVHRHTGVYVINGDELDELHLRTDGGRLVRPLLLAHELAYTNYRRWLDGHVYDSTTSVARVQIGPASDNHTWRRALGTGAEPSWLLLERCRDTIEWLDPMEQSLCRIAMDRAALRSWRSDRDRLAYRYVELMPGALLGLGAALIPYANHNQLPRNMYQAAMGEQAIGVPALNGAARMDTHAYELCYPQRPLAQTSVESAIDGLRELPTGQNVVVAIMCYDGHNLDDALIMNRAAVERGLFASWRTRSYRVERRRYGSTVEEFGLAGASIADMRHTVKRYDKIDPASGMPRVRATVRPNDVIVAKTSVHYGADGNEDSRHDCSLVAQQHGVVDAVYRAPPDANGSEMVRVRVLQMRQPEVGDKFSSRHGQKGVVGALLAPEDMPFNPVSGMVPDLIVNPHGYTSRMTIGQLLECVGAKAAALSGTLCVSTPLADLSEREIDATRAVLRRAGMHVFGREPMYNGMTGEPVRTLLVFAGPVYYQALAHLARDKLHARSRGPVQLLTRQPIEGRAREGGLRWGEMERDCMFAHGGVAVLRDRIMQSDRFELWLCNRCGSICAPKSDTDQNRRPYCVPCGSFVEGVAHTMPYAAKLTVQEVMSMGVDVRLRV